MATRFQKLGSKCVLALYLYDLARATTDATATSRCECSEDGFASAIDDAIKQVKGGKIPIPTLTPTPTVQVVSIRGLAVSEVSGEERLRAHLPHQTSNGVLVASVDIGSSAHAAGIKVGDIITQIGVVEGQGPVRIIPIEAVEDLGRVLRTRDSVMVTLWRSRSSHTVALRKDAAGPASTVKRPSPKSSRIPLAAPTGQK